MKEVCVITGGGSGMGFETAKIMGKTHFVIISGRTVSKLENAIKELKEQGIECQACACDVSNSQSVENLAKMASEIGQIQALIHAAGMSPHMGSSQNLIKTNALGTVLVNKAFSKYMTQGGCIIDLSSMSAYMVPDFLIPKKVYKKSLNSSGEDFVRAFVKKVNIFPKKIRRGVAYSLSKNFVIWYAKKTALELGDKGIRVLSVTPGTFETPMGKLEGGEALSYTKKAAIKRAGRPEEIAFLLASIADKRNSYLTATDIICDGGVVACQEK
ncbi:MAG: SDR family oxidoreductase [Treponema sp.]|nr:SDR family oxidoreductase [Treponema sp.]